MFGICGAFSLATGVFLGSDGSWLGIRLGASKVVDTWREPATSKLMRTKPAIWFCYKVIELTLRLNDLSFPFPLDFGTYMFPWATVLTGP